MIVDPRTDRMRIVVAVGAVDGLGPSELYRMLQAGFETTHDARYAIARATVWSMFAHPLRSLSDRDFLSGLGQAVNLAGTFGSTYSSGLAPGDGLPLDDPEWRRLIEELMSLGDAL